MPNLYYTQRTKRQSKIHDTGIMNGRLFCAVLVGLFFHALVLPLASTSGWCRAYEKDLTELSLDELMNIDVTVTTLSKKEEPLHKAAAAMSVVTQEDIRRSGATSIPDALRMVPGLYVGRIDSHRWTVASRGFADEFTEKLLVLIDGRSIYTPLFGGVYWDVQDTMIEDIDRIEVIRGPGSTLWGANAVNGVINIITKRAKDSQGWLLNAGAGSEEKGFGGIRYGGMIGEHSHYRVYAKYFERDDLVNSDGDRAHDEWDAFRAGFRMDWNITEKNSVTFQGDIYSGEAERISVVPALAAPYFATDDKGNKFEGGNLLTRWTRTISDTAEMTLLLYYDRTERSDDILDPDVRDQFDIDFQHSFALGNIHSFTWGLGYRFAEDEVGRAEFMFSDPWVPTSKKDDLYSAFIQDEICLIPDALKLIVGSKFEDNEYTGFEVQPGARAVWTPKENQCVWVAVTRSVRIPSRSDHTTDLPFSVVPPNPPAVPLPMVVSVVGDDGVDPEELIAYELGYRVRPKETLSLDIAVFYNDYDKLRTYEWMAPVLVPPFFELSILTDNKLKGTTYGLEIAGEWQVKDIWKLSGAYSFIKMDLDLDSDSTARPVFEEANCPRNQVSLSSTLDLPRSFEFDANFKYVDSFKTARDYNPTISQYTRVDFRLGWHSKKGLELSLALQNAFDEHHEEFVHTLFNPASEPERSIYGKVTYRF